MILSREDVRKYRTVIESLKGISSDTLNRIYGFLHADTCQQLWADKYNLKAVGRTNMLAQALG